MLQCRSNALPMSTRLIRNKNEIAGWRAFNSCVASQFGYSALSSFGSRRFSKVVIQQSAKPVTTPNSSSFIHCSDRNDQSVTEALMVPFQMIMGNEFVHRLT